MTGLKMTHNTNARGSTGNQSPKEAMWLSLLLNGLVASVNTVSSDDGQSDHVEAAHELLIISL